ncbi:hypothetical protein, partial [Aquabacterium sp.]|uniref:hypothetical protein n=1 Tax=Aquabacterium sp. TaxID=1872578 RepID=UPI002C9890D8
MSIRFAGPGDDVYLRDLNDPSKKLKQILWGDFLNVVEETPDLLKVSWGKDKTGNPVHFWVRRQDTQAERLLELVFVDVGQGDGCLLVVPLADGSERLMLVDAGEGDNMLRFLLWRFGKFRNDFHFHAAVITHPDQDHYLGFQKLFELPTVHVDNVYHNGIGERQGADPLGPLDAARRHLVDLVASHADAQALYGGAIDQGGKRYARLMRTALQSGRVGNVQMLSTATALIENGRAWMPGFSPATNADATIEVLGPVVEPDAAGQPRLRTFGASISAPAMDVGKTKNGHSVLLRLSYRGLSLLLGGDLNRPAENFLLRHYAGIAAGQPLSAAVQGARARFQSDVMKSCHHGATDVTDEFLQAVNPFAFVVS